MLTGTIIGIILGFLFWVVAVVGVAKEHPSNLDSDKVKIMLVVVTGMGAIMGCAVGLLISWVVDLLLFLFHLVF